jgi:hypothetical protein
VNIAFPVGQIRAREGACEFGTHHPCAGEHSPSPRGRAGVRGNEMFENACEGELFRRVGPVPKTPVLQDDAPPAPVGPRAPHGMVDGGMHVEADTDESAHTGGVVPAAVRGCLVAAFRDRRTQTKEQSARFIPKSDFSNFTPGQAPASTGPNRPGILSFWRYDP